MGTPTVVARQAIYGSDLTVVAYELLFRTLQPTGERPTDQDAATAEVLMAAFTDIGLDDLVGDHRAFVNIPRGILVDGFCRTLPKERVVLEILEDVEVDDEVVAAVQALAADGFTIALDDFEFTPRMRPLVEAATIIKLDMLALTDDRLELTLARLRPFKVKLLAEKVEDASRIDALRAMGFELFQGYALDRPAVVRSARTSSNRIVLLQVVAELYRPETEFDDLVEIISRDPMLVYALLRIVNSASFAQRSRVESMRQALVLLGMDGLRNWATIILMTRLNDGSPAVMMRVLVRAKMCERAGRILGLSGASAFTVGLLSALPDVIGEPLAQILERISLEPAVERALLDREGAYGDLLTAVLAYEESDDEVLLQTKASSVLAPAFLESVAWARKFESFMTAGAVEPEARSA